MKLYWQMLFILSLAAISCDRKNDHANKKAPAAIIEKEEESEQDRLVREKEGKRIDDLHIKLALEDGLSKAYAAEDQRKFYLKYTFQGQNAPFELENEILIDDLFKDKNRYCLLKRHLPWGTCIDLFKMEDDTFKNVISREQFGFTYINDTIFDVNGDGFMDFAVHWYPNSGCCKRDSYSVYLKQNGTHLFTKEYDFINPTFSPKEKIVRGLCYGHPGEAELYKYKWNGLIVDTIEFVHLERDLSGEPTGNVIISKYGPYVEKNNPYKRLKDIPIEYQSITSLNWFYGGIN